MNLPSDTTQVLRAALDQMWRNLQRRWQRDFDRQWNRRTAGWLTGGKIHGDAIVGIDLTGGGAGNIVIDRASGNVVIDRNGNVVTAR
jgi:hypothetical protein